MAQNSFGCVSIESRERHSSTESTNSDSRPVNQSGLNPDSNYTDVYQFQAPKQAEVFLSKDAKLCQISPVKIQGSKYSSEIRKTTCHCIVAPDNGNYLVSNSSRIMGANHSYSLKSRQDMKKNGDEKFSSTDDLCIKPDMSDKVPHDKDFHTLSKRDMVAIPSSPITKENGQEYSYAYSEAKCNTTPRNRVRLGEYTEPVDATNFTWGHKSRKSSQPSENYSEPYETRKLCDLKQSPSWKRRLHPGGGVVYELAKPPEVIYDQPPSQEEEEEDTDQEEECEDYNKLNQSDPKSPKSKQKIADNYDHIPETEHCKEIQNVLDGYDSVNPPGCDLKQLVINPDSATYSLASEIKTMPIKQIDDPSIYEEPWDSKVKQMELQSKLQRAHSRTEEQSKFITQLSSPTSTTSSSSFEEKRSSPEMKTKKNIQSPSDFSRNAYEDAWDSPQRQQQLQEQFQRVKGVVSSHSAENMYEDAWDTQEKIAQLEKQMQKAINHDSSQPKFKPPEMDTYSEPWDSEAKQKEMQERFLASQNRVQRKQSAGSLSTHSTSSQPSRKSSSPSSPTRWNMYPESRHDDSLDPRLRARNSTSTTRSNQSSTSSGGSPTHRVLVGGRQPGFGPIGERINPSIPVDCQSWYHGNISRNDAEKMLRVSKEGSYLVRDSESERGQKSLSLKSFSMNIHVKITKKINGKYVLGENSRDFSSIPEMIDYYSCHLLPLRGAEHITLLHPVNSKWSDQR